jgi:hypothetical protein
LSAPPKAVPTSTNTKDKPAACGGADNVRCAAGDVCLISGDDVPVAKGDNTAPAATGTCEKDDNATAGDGDNIEGNGELCTPGADVFCRCADRREGNKKCLADGQSYDACVCTSEIPE